MKLDPTRPSPRFERGAEVHLWRIVLDVSPEVVAGCADVLHEGERARARRFVRRGDGDHFVVCRGAVRMVLGSYLGRPPQDLEFVYSPHGKPSLSGGGALRFNVSHSHGSALCAVTANRDVGVDIEYVDRALKFEPLAERFFSPFEVAALRRIPASHRCAAFFRCWTRKEAFVKATGRGLSQALDAFAVSLDAHDPRLVWASDPEAVDRWWLGSADETEFTAAVAVEQGGERPLMRQIDWPHEHVQLMAGACR